MASAQGRCRFFSQRVPRDSQPSAIQFFLHPDNGVKLPRAGKMAHKQVRNDESRILVQHILLPTPILPPRRDCVYNTRDRHTFGPCCCLRYIRVLSLSRCRVRMIVWTRSTRLRPDEDVAFGDDDRIVFDTTRLGGENRSPVFAHDIIERISHRLSGHGR